MNNLELHTEDQILRDAQRREIEARDFYAHLLTRSHVAEVRELLALLKGEEEKHLDRVEKMLTQLNLAEKLRP